jgi:hypothetical protein
MSDPVELSTALTNYEWFHGAWSALISLFLGLIIWNAKRAIKELDQKADKEDLLDHKADVQRRFGEMQDSMKELLKNQADQHRDNTTRLDAILKEVYRRGDQKT